MHARGQDEFKPDHFAAVLAEQALALTGQMEGELGGFANRIRRLSKVSGRKQHNGQAGSEYSRHR